MTKEQVMIEATKLMKEMTSKERGQFVSDLMQISIQLTLGECCSNNVKDVLDKTKDEVQ